MKNSIIIFLCVFITACTKKDPIKKLDINQSLIAISNKVNLDTAGTQKIQFCELVHFKDWDKMIIIPPYLPWEMLEKQQIDNLHQLKDSIIYKTLNDSKCTLLFLRDNKITAYAVVDRMPIDFAEPFYNDKIPKPVLKDMLCKIGRAHV